jgi:hypothetical protein
LKNLCKPTTKRRENLEEDGIRSSQRNLEDVIGRCMELGEDDKKLTFVDF